MIGHQHVGMQRHGESTPALAQAVQKVTVIVFAEKQAARLFPR
ncbi:MAG: hypothetical protein ACREUD_05335 [Gammaproteobacteria bacterium]